MLQSEHPEDVRARLSSELAEWKQQLSSLKSKFHQRAEARQKIRGPEYWTERLGSSYVNWDNPEQREHAEQLEKLMGAALLDASTTLPMAEAELHKQLLAGPNGLSYQRHVAGMKLNSAKKPLLRLAVGDGAISICAMTIGAANHMFVTHIDRGKLCSGVGITDPLASVAPPSQQQPAQQQQQPAQQQQQLPPPPGGGMALPGPPQPMPYGSSGYQQQQQQQQHVGGYPAAPGVPPPVPPPLPPPHQQLQAGGKRHRHDDELAELLEAKTVKNRDRLERGEEVLELLDKPTTRQAAQREVFKTHGGAAITEQCPHLTKEACRAASHSASACHRLHLRKVLYPHTDERLGNCSFLNTCRNPRMCKHIHYEFDPEPDNPAGAMALQRPSEVPSYLRALPEGQWIKCDIRNIDLSILGKFGVIMTDPPWEIHQDLPYGTLMDDELRGMNVGCLQDDGVIFMWVTGRAMELGRELLHQWGYDRVDELIWVKTNMLQRLIRTGRTGHWLNHSKEHCLVGVKGKPQLNRWVDTDVLMAPVRNTSQKPDEMYPLLERLSPGTRKLEIFARQHNIKPGWIGLGNQLNGTHLLEQDLLQRYIQRHGPPELPSPNFDPPK